MSVCIKEAASPDQGCLGTVTGGRFPLGRLAGIGAIHGQTVRTKETRDWKDERAEALILLGIEIFFYICPKFFIFALSFYICPKFFLYLAVDRDDEQDNLVKD